MTNERQMTRTRIKMCGLTRKQDVEAAVFAGADALGFVLWSGSKRAVTPEQLAALVTEVPPFVTRVGLFVDASPALIRQCLPHLDAVQFHGQETPAQCAQVEKPWFKAVRMAPEVDIAAEVQQYRQGKALLLDAYRPGVPGGTGEVFDWQRIPEHVELPVILAGGLNGENVASAIARVHPFAVDVSGGIESAPGVKCAARMKAFVAAVRQADKAFA